MDDHVPPVPNEDPSGEWIGEVSSPVPDGGGPSFPGLLPAPVPATDKVVRRVGWVASLGASLVVLLVGRSCWVGWPGAKERIRRPFRQHQPLVSRLFGWSTNGTNR